MKKVAKEILENEWSQYVGYLHKANVHTYFDLDKLKEEMFKTPCALNEEKGTSFEGALLIHINLSIALALRTVKTISATFNTLDETSLVKVLALMHISKRFMFMPNDNEWEIHKLGRNFKFTDLEACLKFGDRSALEVLNLGIHLTPTEFEAFKSSEDDSDATRKANFSILSLVVQQANEMAYAIEKERYNKSL